jgi:anti-anti-sigma factor
MDEIKTLNRTKVLADFRDVPSAGSACLSFIAGMYRTSGGRLVLARTQARVREVLDITGLSAVIPLAADIESGLATLRAERSAVQKTQSQRVP